MHLRLLLLFLILSLLPYGIRAQSTSISFELNGRLSNNQIQNSIHDAKNPFARFIGEWTLKEDTWIQNWGDKTDTLKIPKHHTISNQINTENTLFSIIDGPEPNGHIFWSYNPNTKKIQHLSSFGKIRAGLGEGKFYGNNNVKLKISFEGEPSGTYRIYTYEWIHHNEYALQSIQFDHNDQPTGLFYKGNFVRIHADSEIEKEIEAILNILDNNTVSKEKQIKVFTEDIIHMAPNHKTITNKKELLTYLKQQKEYGYSDMKHTITEFSRHENIIIMRGQVRGVFYPSNGTKEINFLTKNLFVFSRVNGILKISKVIYNMSPRS